MSGASDDYPFLQKKENRIELQIHLVPHSSKEALLGVYNGKLKVAVHAPPVAHKANKALISLISKVLRCPKKNISLIKGERSREKTISIIETSLEKVRVALDEWSFSG